MVGQVYYIVYIGVLGGVLFIKFIYPFINKMDAIFDKGYFKAVTVCLILFMIFNVAISGLVGVRQLERKNNIAANSYMDTFFDKYYPDEKLKVIYSNVKMVNSN